MKRRILFIFFVACGVCLGDPDYPLQFSAQLSRRDFGGMEKTLKDWRKSRPDDVEWFSAQGNYFYLLAQKDAPVLSNPSVVETPVVWCPVPLPMAGPPARNPAYFKPTLISQAVTCWRSAIASHPQRLDLSFDLARLYQDVGDFDAQYDVLILALQYADKHPKGLRWKGNQGLPLPFSQFIPPLLQQSIAYYLGQGRPEAWAKAHRLIRLAVTFFPNDPYFYNSLAAYYSTQGDWPRTMKYLLIASDKDPQESLFIFNIGNTLVGMGKPREARIYYQKVVRMEQNPDYVEAAKTFLRTSTSQKD